MPIAFALALVMATIHADGYGATGDSRPRASWRSSLYKFEKDAASPSISPDQVGAAHQLTLYDAGTSRIGEPSMQETELKRLGQQLQESKAKREIWSKTHYGVVVREGPVYRIAEKMVLHTYLITQFGIPVCFGVDW